MDRIESFVFDDYFILGDTNSALRETIGNMARLMYETLERDRVWGAKIKIEFFPDLEGKKPVAAFCDNKIILASKQERLYQVAYQFSHELCHYVIGKKQYDEKSKMYWIEEVFCELSSLYWLEELAKKWGKKSKYYQDIAENLKNYVRNTISDYSQNVRVEGFRLEELSSGDDFYLWLKNRILGYQDTHNNFSNDQRSDFCVVALRLWPLFSDGRYWNMLQYICDIDPNAENLDEFFERWKNVVPQDGRELIVEMEKKLIKRS